MLCKGEGRTRFLGRKNKIKIRKIVVAIRHDKYLLDKYLRLCNQFGHSDIICISSMPMIIRNVLYALYRDNVEPIASIVDSVIKRGYISVDILNNLPVACDVECNKGEERRDGEEGGDEHVLVPEG